jgi:hypothetical protein
MEENKKIAMRVIHQVPAVKSRSNDSLLIGESPRRVTEKTFYESRIKERKLPKLIEMRT